MVNTEMVPFEQTAPQKLSSFLYFENWAEACPKRLIKLRVSPKRNDAKKSANTKIIPL
jgi:hypothetical protein